LKINKILLDSKYSKDRLLKAFLANKFIAEIKPPLKSLLTSLGFSFFTEYRSTEESRSNRKLLWINDNRISK